MLHPNVGSAMPEFAETVGTTMHKTVLRRLGMRRKDTFARIVVRIFTFVPSVKISIVETTSGST